jgi:hypothetical protein
MIVLPGGDDDHQHVGSQWLGSEQRTQRIAIDQWEASLRNDETRTASDRLRERVSTILCELNL